MNRTAICTIHDLLFLADQDPAAPALESPGYDPLTYQDLRDQVAEVVKVLNTQGFCAQDRIAVVLPGGPEMAVALLSVEAGFTAAPLNPEHKEHEFRLYFSILGIRGVLVEQHYPTAARDVARELSLPVIEIVPLRKKAGAFEISDTGTPSAKEPVYSLPPDTALVLLTSGTTSSPKIVPFSQDLLCEITRVCCDCYSDMDPGKPRFLHCVSFYHIFGVTGNLLMPLLSGGTVICVKNFIASDFIHLVRTCRPTYYCVVPAVHQSILQEIKKDPAGAKHTSLHYTATGSATLPYQVRVELEDLLGIPMVEGYGLTEATLIALNSPYRRGAAGRVVIESLAILDEEDRKLPANQEGEILVRGKVVFGGYENAPEENARAFHNGWFRTGDMGYVDEDGYLFLTGRKKELINKGGEKISPAEIDEVLESHPGVREAMAFRIFDPVLGEDIAAMAVVTGPEITEQVLRMHVLDHLVQFKVPRRIHIVDTIPRTPTGKPRRHAGTQWDLDHRKGL